MYAQQYKYSKITVVVRVLKKVMVHYTEKADTFNLSINKI